MSQTKINIVYLVLGIYLCYQIFANFLNIEVCRTYMAASESDYDAILLLLVEVFVYLLAIIVNVIVLMIRNHRQGK